MAAARQLLRRAGREEAGRFLVEGAPAVVEALGWAADGGRLRELFVTATAAHAHPELVEAARQVGARCTEITERAAATLSDTVTAQGLVAVCDLVTVPVPAALGSRPRLVAVLVGIADPGNAGAVLRVADAAGADAVVLAGDAVDPHNGKCVRASAGSLFHLPVARDRDVDAVLAACRGAGLALLAADGRGELDLDDATDGGRLAAPSAWLFGSEAHGLPPQVGALAEHRIRVPLHGRAESLNLATAAAVCLYAAARAQRRPTGVRPAAPVT